jgi:L-fucose isomerase-like protein
VDPWGQENFSIDDVVIDEPAGLAMRLRALAGLKNTLGKRVVCVGGPSGWGVGGRKAPGLARQIWKFELVDVSYAEFGERLKKARGAEARVRQAKGDTAEYLSRKNTRLETKREFLENAFLVNAVFLDLMAEHRTDAITINQCMSTIMPIGETTACMPLSLLNDAGLQAYCESDFVAIPSGVLLSAISSRPAFLNNPTFPHHGIITQAHCTAPRRMDGRNEEPVRILTHFESDYGASPKVEMRKGQRLTNIVPDFEMKRYVGFEGEVAGNPFMPVCRSQIEVGILGDERRLAGQMRGFHWMTGYGNYLAETGYALGKLGIGWRNLSLRS